jgi:hypothetical protein
MSLADKTAALAQKEAASDPTPAKAAKRAKKEADRITQSADELDGFAVAVGNGLFWLLPYIMYWAATTTIHSGMFDNGRLDQTHAK